MLLSLEGSPAWIEFLPEWNEDTLLLLLKIALALNVACFLAYGWDKLAAKRDARRVPELVLLAVSLPATAIGAWAAVIFLRHKSSKWSYKWKLIAVTILQSVAVFGPLLFG